MDDNMVTQTNANPVQTQPMLPQAPVESTVPELEQVLVKTQELEQRIGDVELEIAKDVTNQGPENNFGENEVMPEKYKQKVETLAKKFKEFSQALKEAEELTGVPEIKKDEKKETPEKAANADVPQAQTSEVGTPEKTGAPVAGAETGLDGGKKQDRGAETEAEKDIQNKVPKPSTDYPKDSIQKNSLDQQPAEEAPKTPEEMETENGKKVPDVTYESLYKGIQERLVKETQDRIAEKKNALSGRKTVVGASSGMKFRETSRTDSTSAAKEYLQKAGIRL